MRKFSIIFLILFLILLTAIVKNSTKRIDDEIFATEENLRDLKKDLDNIRLEYDYLSSAEKLTKFQEVYFDDEFIKKDIQEMKIIENLKGKLTIEKFQLNNN